MQIRHFLDSDGRRWRVWAVHPEAVLGERRAGGERRGRDAAVLADPPVLERRRTERRLDQRRHRADRSRVLPALYRGGWLVFETEGDGERGETRRLAPIPPDWADCPERELAALLPRARGRPRQLS